MAQLSWDALRLVVVASRAGSFSAGPYQRRTKGAVPSNLLAASGRNHRASNPGG